MTTDRNGKGHRSYRRQAKALRRKGLPCAWCGKPIDYNAPTNHDDAFTADHWEVALGNGGSLNRQELKPMHRGCNRKKGTKQLPKIRPAT